MVVTVKHEGIAEPSDAGRDVMVRYCAASLFASTYCRR
jgi:hypothetical protein